MENKNAYLLQQPKTAEVIKPELDNKSSEKMVDEEQTLEEEFILQNNISVMRMPSRATTKIGYFKPSNF